jgi:UDP-glucuronate decarboxylase
MTDRPLIGKKNVLVTGGAGFIGSFLCERLLRDGNRVICVDNFITSSQENIDHLLKEPDFELIRHDINEPFDPDDLPELKLFNLKLNGISEIYHLACPRTGRRFDDLRLQTMLTSSVGLHNVLEIADKYKSRFFLASSAAVYGRSSTGSKRFKEGEYGTFDRQEIPSTYDEGKRWSETVADTYRRARGIDCRIGRVFRTFGPRMHLNDGHLVPDLIVKALDGEVVTMHGGPELRTTLTYVTDMVDGIVKLMEVPVDPGPVNLGSDDDIRVSEVAERIIALTGSSSKIAFVDAPVSPSHSALPDITKAREELGWAPITPLDKALERTIEYVQGNRRLVTTEYDS